MQIVENLVYTYGRVNGSRDLDVILDTGTSITAIAPQVAREVHLRRTGSGRAFGAGGASTNLDLASGVTLNIGLPGDSYALADQRVAVLPIAFASQETGHPTDAFFGSNVFANSCVSVDYFASSVAIARGPCSGKPRGQAVPILLFNGAPFVNARVEDSSGRWVNGTFLLDSGATAPLVISARFFHGHTDLAVGGRTVALPATRDVSGRVPLHAVRVRALTIGPFLIDAPVGAIAQSTSGLLASGQIAGFIGAPVLGRFTVTWDYARSLVFLQPNAHFGDRFDADGSGMRLVAAPPDYTRLRVAGMVSDGSAARAGIRDGDAIVAVNGVRGLRLWEVAAALRKTGPVRLTIERGRRIIDVTVDLQSRI